MYTENQPTSNNGYVRPLLVTHIPGMGGQLNTNNINNSYPNTPQAMFQPQSPDTASVMSDTVNRSVSCTLTLPVALLTFIHTRSSREI